MPIATRLSSTNCNRNARLLADSIAAGRALPMSRRPSTSDAILFVIIHDMQNRRRAGIPALLTTQSVGIIHYGQFRPPGTYFGNLEARSSGTKPGTHLSYF
jgi:hypothetical protein